MDKLEKVIKGLEELRRYADNEIHPVVSPDNWIVYSRLIDLIEETENNVHVLLRAQEPVTAVKLQSKKYIGRTGIAYDGSCGNCNAYLMRAWRACPLCGKAVKWND